MSAKMPWNTVSNIIEDLVDKDLTFIQVVTRILSPQNLSRYQSYTQAGASYRRPRRFHKNSTAKLTPRALTVPSDRKFAPPCYCHGQRQYLVQWPQLSP